jgi:hypothetical protein
VVGVAVVGVAGALVVEVVGVVGGLVLAVVAGGGTKVSLQNPLLFTILLTPPLGWGWPPTLMASVAVWQRANMEQVSWRLPP